MHTSLEATAIEGKNFLGQIETGIAVEARVERFTFYWEDPVWKNSRVPTAFLDPSWHDDASDIINSGPPRDQNQSHSPSKNEAGQLRFQICK
jgi:hypothetical protein